MNTRRSYTKDFKLEAVRLADEHGYAQTARDLDLHPSLLRRWKKRLHEDGARAFPGHGSPRDEELARLRRELQRAQEEVAILKKAVGIFTSRPRTAAG